MAFPTQINPTPQKRLEDFSDVNRLWHGYGMENSPSGVPSVAEPFSCKVFKAA